MEWTIYILITIGLTITSSLITALLCIWQFRKKEKYIETRNAYEKLMKPFIHFIVKIEENTEAESVNKSVEGKKEFIRNFYNVILLYGSPKTIMATKDFLETFSKKIASNSKPEDADRLEVKQKAMILIKSMRNDIRCTNRGLKIDFLLPNNMKF